MGTGFKAPVQDPLPPGASGGQSAGLALQGFINMMPSSKEISCNTDLVLSQSTGAKAFQKALSLRALGSSRSRPHSLS
jgi:hypothetical protein